MTDIDRLLNSTFSSDSEDDESSELHKKIQAIKQVLEDPPDSLWNYDMIESIVIQYEESRVLSEKQIEVLEKAYDQHC